MSAADEIREALSHSAAGVMVCRELIRNGRPVTDNHRDRLRELRAGLDLLITEAGPFADSERRKFDHTPKEND